jgi:hypothetical protein
MTEQSPPQSTNPPTRDLEDVHRDIALANQYRMEFIKHTMSLATAVLVFTVTFIKDTFSGTTMPKAVLLITLGWLALSLSLMGGLGHMWAWDRYYISYRKDYQGKRDEGEARRKKADFYRRIAAFVQVSSFAAGLVLIILFYYLNIKG